MNEAGTPPPPPAATGGYRGRTRYSQLEYEAVLANAMIGIAFTRERRFFLCNPRFEEMLGWGPGELVGQSGEQVYVSGESYRELAGIAVPVLSAGGRLDVEWPLRRRDGSSFIARIVAKAIDPEQPRQGTIWIAEDITERRRVFDEATRLAREQEALLDNVVVGIVFVRDRRIERCNARFEALFGYPRGALAGESTRVVYFSDEEWSDRRSSYEEMDRGATHARDQRLRRRDGSGFWCHLSGRAVLPGDPAQGYVWLFEDVSERRNAEAELRRLSDEQQLILDNAVVGIAFIGEREIRRCNRRLEEMAGVAAGDLAGRSTEMLFASREEWQENLRAAANTPPGGSAVSEWRFRRLDGETFLCRSRGRRIDGRGSEREWIWSFEDVTAERESEERLRAALLEFELVLRHATVGIAFVRQRLYQRVNHHFEAMFGFDTGAAVGRSSEVLYEDREAWGRFGAEAYPQLAGGGSWSGEMRLRRLDGSTFWCKVVGRALDPARVDEGSIWIYDDVSAEHAARETLERSREALERVVAERTAELRAANERLEAEMTVRKQAESRARHLADHDPLTGLPNRRLLEDRLEQALVRAQRNRTLTAVMYVDLDHFKQINDTLGHEVGDQLLQEIARRLTSDIRSGDTVCRVGGDEFVLVLPELRRSSDPARVAAKAIEMLSAPVQIGGHALQVTPSIGIAVYPQDGADAQTLLRNADAAMYHAKESGRANSQFFTEQMNIAADRRLALEADLRRAIGTGELRPHFQPVRRVADNALAGYEALLRWHHPGRGLVLPAEFLPVAEDAGLMAAIGECTLAAACAHAATLAGEPPPAVTVNLSVREFADPKLAERVAQALRDTDLAASRLELDLSEAALAHNPVQALAAMQRLKALGVRLAIDDFGIGGASLAGLHRMPVDRVKIDRTLVAGLPAVEESRRLVAGMVALAHALGREALAEGVETEAQLAFLRECGCDAWQGHLGGGAEPAAETTLRDGGAEPAAETTLRGGGAESAAEAGERVGKGEG